MERAETAAAKIKSKVDPDLAGLVHRDRELLGSVCDVLGLPPNPINFAQVSVLMTQAGLAAHNEYPKMVFPNGPKEPGVIVADEQAEKAVSKPAKAEKHAEKDAPEPAKPAKAEK